VGRTSAKVLLFFILWLSVTWLRTAATERHELIWYVLLGATLTCGAMAGWSLKELYEKYSVWRENRRR
jgi:heme A synthase